ncbi:unnamed protein product, partial [Pylaiella littoralis]
VGTSFRGDDESLVVVVDYEYDSFAISITEEDDHYVYSTSTSLESVTSSGLQVITGPFNAGHLRSSSYSLGGAVAFILLDRGESSSMVDVFESSDMWWLSQSVDSGSLVHDNVKGAEESWPGMADYVEYQKATESVQYSFTVGQIEVTLISSWFFPLAWI